MILSFVFVVLVASVSVASAQSGRYSFWSAGQYDNLGGYGYYGDQYGNGHIAAIAVGQVANVVGQIVTNNSNNSTVVKVAEIQAQLENKRIDDGREMGLLRFYATDRKETELREFRMKLEDGRRYTPRKVGAVSQSASAQVQPRKIGRTLHNRSSCEVKIFQNGQLVFTLFPHTPPVPILDDEYSWETNECSIQVDDQGDKIVISPGR